MRIDPSRSIGIGVVGCGEIAQLMHLPIVQELPGLHIAALCDLSPSVLDGLGARYGVAARSTDHRDVVADPAVDAVLVCTYDHGPVVAEALAAGKHVMVEKPLAFTPEEAEPLVAEAERRSLVALVGYMKIYDPGYRLGLERIAAIGRPRMVHMHDFGMRFDRYQQLYSQLRGQDVDTAALAATKAEVAARIRDALGCDHAGYLELFLTILMLGSHDLAVLRCAFGRARRVRYAQALGPTHVLAMLELADNVPALVEIAFGPRYEWWDEWMTVHGETDEVRIDFANPYLRNAAATVRVREAAGDAPAERVLQGTPDTAFRRQWLHFADCIRTGRPPLTPLTGGLDDLRLAVDIVRALPPRPEAWA